MTYETLSLAVIILGATLTLVTLLVIVHIHETNDQKKK